jgi:hypothetical protein
MDLSNVLYGAGVVADLNGESRRQVRLAAHNLVRLLAAGRSIKKAIVVADVQSPRRLRQELADAGCQVITRERGIVTNTEQANDETLLNRLYEAIVELRPAVVVVATGDGNGHLDGHGFVHLVRFARSQGCGVEIASWEHALNPALRTETEASLGVVISLDAYYWSLTRCGPRPPTPMDSRRKTAERVSQAPHAALSAALAERRNWSYAYPGRLIRAQRSVT